MKISVVIPVYNGEAYLRSCLESVTGSRRSDIEIIVVDDGSTDGSGKIIEEFEARDHRLRIIFQENTGVSGARNRGLSAASGEYIYFADCDDILYPDALWQMYDTARETGADLVVGNYRYLYDYSGELKNASIWLEKRVFTGEERISCTHFSCILPNKLWKREIMKRYGLEFYPLKMGEDLSFFLRYLAVSDRVATVPDCVYDYRLHEGSASYSYSLSDLDYIQAFELVEQFYRELGGMEEFIRELKYDRMFYYIRIFKRLPRFHEKQLRKQLAEAYVQAEERLDCSDVRERKDIMKLVRQFKWKKRFRRLYESDLYAFFFQTARDLKHRWIRSVSGGRSDFR